MDVLRSALAAAVAFGLLSSCVNMVTPPGILVASTPPGARISVDGLDSGFVTPCSIALEGDEKHWVQLALEGYATTDLYLDESRHVYIVPWVKGQAAQDTFAFPLFLPAVDLLLPVQVDNSPSPKRIHVKLRLSAE